MRVSGKVMNDVPHIKRGSHHTLELEAPRKFTLQKQFWDSVALDMLRVSLGGGSGGTKAVFGLSRARA